MEKQEFLERLEDALRTELPEQEIRGHIQYYDAYIREQLRKGRTEAEILSALGDPRLIARTILETSGNRSGESWTEDRGETEKSSERSKRVLKIKKLWKFAGATAAVLVVLWLIAVLVRFLIPIVLPILLAVLIASYLRKRL